VTLSLSELAALVGGQFAVEAGAVEIRGIGSIREAGEGDVTFYGNQRYLAALKKCRASAALVPLDFQEEVPPVCVRVENPTLAFSRLIAHFAPPPARYEPGIHPTAVVGEGVEIGEGASIQPYAVLEPGARIGARTVVGAHCSVGRAVVIGDDCLLYPHVTIGERCRLGHRVIIHSGTVLGSDGFGFEMKNGRHQKIPQIGIVQVDDDVEIGANCAIDRARFGRTWIRQGSKLDNLIQIAHNVEIGEHCIVVSQVGISGSTRLGNYVVLGGQVGIVGHIEIGDQAMVAAQSGVTKSLAAGGTYQSTPAAPLKEVQREKVLVRRLQSLVDRVAQLEQELGSRADSSPENR
jgi:UDP-3-O-[3-hydroxymyristoyl] glucosamine N-acyltransferase